MFAARPVHDEHGRQSPTAQHDTSQADQGPATRGCRSASCHLPQCARSTAAARDSAQLHSPTCRRSYADGHRPRTPRLNRCQARPAHRAHDPQSWRFGHALLLLFVEKGVQACSGRQGDAAVSPSERPPPRAQLQRASVPESATPEAPKPALPNPAAAAGNDAAPDSHANAASWELLLRYQHARQVAEHCRFERDAVALIGVPETNPRPLHRQSPQRRHEWSILDTKFGQLRVAATRMAQVRTRRVH